MKTIVHHVVLAATLIGSGGAEAATLTGTVRNGTTSRPSSGDGVLLLTLSSDGMKEEARVKTDATGRFVFTIGSEGSHLVRVVHQGVTYHGIVPPNAKQIKVTVYDVSEKVDGISAIMDVQRFEATGDTLEVKQLVTMHNGSNPPRTLMNDHPFEFQLPPMARVKSGLVQVEDGPPLKQSPVAGEARGQYYFAFPIRPGDTRFAVIYQVPYNGAAVIETKVRNPLERFVVMLPKSIKFEPKEASMFHPMPDTTRDHVEGTGPVMAGETVSFSISGTGILEELQGRRIEAGEDQTTSKDRPGGGLGAPIGLPDPLQQYRWRILGGMAMMMLVGGALVVGRARSRLPAIVHQPDSRKISIKDISKQTKRCASAVGNRHHSARSPASCTRTHQQRTI